MNTFKNAELTRRFMGVVTNELGSEVPLTVAWFSCPRYALDISGTPGSPIALKRAADEVLKAVRTKPVASLLPGGRAVAIGTVSLRLDLTPELETLLVPSFRMLVAGMPEKQVWLAAEGASCHQLVVTPIPDGKP